MSSSIPVPTQAARSGTRTTRSGRHHRTRSSIDSAASPGASSSAMTPTLSSASSSASPPSPCTATPTRSAKSRGKQPMYTLPQLAQPSPSPAPAPKPQQTATPYRRGSRLSESLMEEEGEFIEIGEQDGCPRLISYLSRSQGFIWNPEMFVPSYLDHDYTPLEYRREPIIEITLTEEEIRSIYPE